MPISLHPHPLLQDGHSLGSEYPGMVKEMVEGYINKRHVVIVAVISAMDDLANQASVGAWGMGSYS